MASGSEVGEAPANLGSFLPMDTLLQELDSMTPPTPAKPVVSVTNGRSKPVSGVPTAPMTPMGGVFDVPFSIGRVG